MGPNTRTRFEFSLDPHSFESWMMVQKAARSVTELQPAVSTVTDVLLLLELLGYNNTFCIRHGFGSMHDLASNVCDIIGFYDEEKEREIQIRNDYFKIPIPAIRKSIVDAVTLISPWIGVLALLYLTGFSLWMSKALPASVTIAFIGGVFVGLISSEGLLNAFNRIFSFHYLQGNLVEARRAIKRLYVVTLLAIGVLSYIIFTGSIFFNVPLPLVLIAIFGTATIAIHRASYMILFSTRKLTQILVGYLIAIIVFYCAFSGLESRSLSEDTTRYFVAFSISFASLCIVPGYYTYRLFKSNRVSSKKEPILSSIYTPAFYNNVNTVRSRFGVQLWENILPLISGTLFFILLFGDRIISWFFTPGSLIVSNGTSLPLIFNSAYHVGADLALFTIVPAVVFQFALLASLYSRITNMSIHLRIKEISKIDRFMEVTYKKMVLYTLLIGMVSATVMNVVGPTIIQFLGGNDITVTILRVASFGNVALSLFAGSASIMVFLNRAKYLTLITLASAIVVLVLGMYAGNFGYGQIVYAYLTATILAATLSWIYVSKIVKKSSSTIFAKFS